VLSQILSEEDVGFFCDPANCLAEGFVVAFGRRLFEYLLANAVFRIQVRETLFGGFRVRSHPRYGFRGMLACVLHLTSDLI
jgi:hypothetical protein